jgi:penicillin-binding protein 1A
VLGFGVSSGIVAIAGSKEYSMRQFIDGRSLNQTSVLLANDGALLGAVHEENRICVSLRRVAEPLIRTLVAVEDRRFFLHDGIDIRAIFRATYANIRALRVAQGGSTITQQLARMAVLRRYDRTLRRKLFEVVTAILIERQLTKNQILETYLNAAYFGHNIYGIELASLVYCGKPAAVVDEIEAAYLIGLLKAPARYCYCCNPLNAARRTKLALDLVGAKAHATPTKPSIGVWRPRQSCAEHLPLTIEYVSQCARRWLRKNLSAHYPTARLLVRTTIDVRCQMILELVCRIVRRAGYAGRVACIVQDAHSGAIRALAGGIDCHSQNFNSAIDGCLQPGSLLKPFILLIAIQNGVRLDQKYESRPLTIPLKNGTTWTVRNAGERYLGWISLSDALVVSDNAVYAQLILDLGIDRLRGLLSAVGITVSDT